MQANCAKRTKNEKKIGENVKSKKHHKKYLQFTAVIFSKKKT